MYWDGLLTLAPLPLTGVGSRAGELGAVASRGPGARLSWGWVIRQRSGWNQYVVPIELGVLLNTHSDLVGPVYMGGLTLCIESNPPALLCSSAKLGVGGVMY